jgi:hypothetical protein
MTTHDVRSIERRRSARVAASIPVLVKGQTRSGEEFSVKTQTHTVSLFGCLILLDVEVFVDRKVVLTREDTQQSSRAGSSPRGAILMDEDTWESHFRPSLRIFGGWPFRAPERNFSDEVKKDRQDRTTTVNV